MARARCTRFVEGRGFGFVRPEDGSPDVFVHITKIPGQVPLEEGELVNVEIEDSPRGPRATWVERLG